MRLKTNYLHILVKGWSSGPDPGTNRETWTRQGAQKQHEKKKHGAGCSLLPSSLPTCLIPDSGSPFVGLSPDE